MEVKDVRVTENKGKHLSNVDAALMPEGHQTGILSLMPCKLNVERFTAVVVAQLLSRVSLRPYRLQHAPPLSPSLLFNHLILCHSLFPLFSVFPSISLSQ